MLRRTKIELAAKMLGLGTIVFLLTAFLANRINIKYGGCGNLYPQFDFLFSPHKMFSDFKDVYDQIKNLSPFEDLTTNHGNPYPPLAMLISYPFSVIDRFWGYHISLFLFIAPFVTFYITITYNSIKLGSNYYEKLNDWINTVFLCCAYPVLFMIDRGNFLIFTFIALYFFLKYYEDTSNKNICILALAVASALKIYPLLFLLLFLADKRYKDFFLTIFIIGILSLFPLLLYKEPFFYSLIQTIKDIIFFEDNVWGRNNFSIAATMKYLFRFLNIADYWTYFLLFLKGLMVLVLYLVYRIIKTETAVWKKFLLVSCIALLFPAVVSEYYGFYIFLSLIFLLKDETQNKNDFLYIILCTLFLIPKNYFVIKVSFTIQPYIGSIILIVILITGFRENNNALTLKD